MEKKILRLLSNQNFSIEPLWGYSKLQEILLMREISGSDKDFFKSIKEQTHSVDFYYDNQLITSDPLLTKKGSIAVVSMSGVMTVNDGLCSYGMKSMDKTLRMLYNDKNVSGIVMDIDTGGGYSAAGEVLQNAISDKNKPVVVYTTFLCSAGIKGTLTADAIYAASPSTQVGSIGVFMVMPKLYVKKSKEEDYELYSEDSPNKNEAWRALKRGDTTLYEKHLTKLDESFMKDVRTKRMLRGSEKYIQETLSGRTFNAEEAKRRGLIDGIGTLNTVLNKVNNHLKYYN